MPNQLAKLRLKAFRHQHGLCHYCGTPTWLGDAGEFAKTHRLNPGTVARLQCTAEHLVAVQDGGKNIRKNIVAACQFCNTVRHRRKRHLAPDAYKSHVQRRLHNGGWHSKELRNLRQHNARNSHQVNNKTGHDNQTLDS